MDRRAVIHHDRSIGKNTNEQLAEVALINCSQTSDELVQCAGNNVSTSRSARRVNSRQFEEYYRVN